MTRFKGQSSKAAYLKAKYLAAEGKMLKPDGDPFGSAYRKGWNGERFRYPNGSDRRAAYAAGRDDRKLRDMRRALIDARAERDRKIVELYVAHDVATSNIAERLGIGEKAVLFVLNENGVEVDGGQMRNWA